MLEQPWHDHYEGAVKPHLHYPSVPLTDFLKNSAVAYPNHDAIYFFGKTMTYQQLLEDAYRCANALIRLGVKKNDAVALMLPNIPQYVICYYGILFAGGIVVQTNPLYAERDLEHHFKDSGVETIVCLDLVYAKVKKVKASSRLKNIIVTRIQDALPFPKNLLYPFVQRKKGNVQPIIHKQEPIMWLSRLLSASSSNPVETVINPQEDIAVLQYTGGTTGVSKGVMLTHANLIANVVQSGAWMYRSHKGKEVMLTVVPMFHVYGMTICMNYGISIGAKLVLVPKFDVEALLKLIDSQKVTLFPGAPTMYIGIINEPNSHKYRLDSIECCMSGSAPLPMEVQQSFERLSGGKLVEGYGLSEASPVTHANPIWGQSIIGSIGLPWPDTNCKIIDIVSGESLPPHHIGEIVVKGPQVMKGYWNQPEETNAVLKEGWLQTGDLGYCDEKGYFFIVDRKKDLINAGGFKVYPRDVEEVLFEYPGVKEAVVIGVPHSYRGETVKAYIVPKEGASLTGEELERFCREKLASYKVPRIYEFRNELPKTFIGKVLRRVLADEEKAKLEKSE